MALSAADLQKKHKLEGAPDPFPSLGEDTPKINGTSDQKRRGARQDNLDTNSEVSFPSLGAPKSSPASSDGGRGWGDVNRVKRAAVKTYAVTDSFSLANIDLRSAGKDGKPASLGDVMTQVMAKTNMQIEASTQRMTGQTTFLLKGDSEKDALKAKNLLTAVLSPTVTRVLDAPDSTIGAIVGPKGATLKQIREDHQVKIDIPPRKDIHGNGSTSPHSDDEEEPTTKVTVSGPAPLVEAAIADLKAIIGTRAKKTTKHLKDLPMQVLPFLGPEIPAIEAQVGRELPECSVHISVHIKSKEIILVGDKAAVQLAIDKVEAAIEAWKPKLSSVTVTVPRPQHRFVVGGKGPEELFKECQVIVLAPEQGEGLTLWGEPSKLGSALGVVLQRAGSKHVTSYELPGPLTTAKQIHAYLHRTVYLQSLKTSHPDVTIHSPSEEEIERTEKISFDFVGDALKVGAALHEVKALVKKLEGGVKEIEIDWLVNKVLIGRHGKRIKQFQEAHNVIIFFPPEAKESSSVILVHDPTSAAGSATPSQKQAHLREVADELLKLAADAADVKSETITVEKKWHATIVGKNGTTLNAIIGEEQSLSIKVGSQAKLGLGKEPLPEDAILIRGSSSEVERAIKEIRQIVKDAENDEIENGYNVEFDIPREYIGRIVGAQGSGVNKIRDALGVRVDFDDEADDKGAGKDWTEKGKGKKGSAQKVKVKITGRKENVEDAKKRILAQVEKFADETTEVLAIPRQYHPGLIGPGGKYVSRLEENYGVKITFPRDNDEAQDGSSGPGGFKGRDSLKPGEVLVRGGRKGVAQAKKELLDVVEFEKANNQSASFPVPSKSISRIVGKGGASINEIKDKTGALIDIDKEETASGVATVTVKGTANAIKEAKAAILAVANEIQDETTEVLRIEAKYHRNFIGKGGETLRDLIVKVGGPTDPKQQAGLIHFPRQGEPEDEVRLRGDKALVAKLRKELEKMASTFRDRVVMGVGVPAAQHRGLIGRGGQHLNDLQAKTDTQIWFPGSRAYGSVGDPENIDSLRDVVPEDLVKVFGSKAACQAAIAELSKAHAPQRAPRPAPSEQLSRSIMVPLKYHHIVNQQGNIYRNIRSLGVFVDQSKIPEVNYTPTRPAPAATDEAKTARIDEEEDEGADDVEGTEWQVIPNYQGAPEGDAEWVLRARDEEALDSAEKVIKAAIDHAASSSHVGFLTVADRSAFPRIVGSKGANVSRVRAETGADVNVGKSDNTIVITGTEAAIEMAKASILQTIQSGGKGGRRGD